MRKFRCKKSNFDFDDAAALYSSIDSNAFSLSFNPDWVMIEVKPLTSTRKFKGGELEKWDFLAVASDSRLIYCETSCLNDMQLAIIKHTTGIDTFGKYVIFNKKLNLINTSNKEPINGVIEDAFSMTGAISTKKVEHVRDHVLVMELLSFIASNQSDIDSCISETLDIIE